MRTETSDPSPPEPPGPPPQGRAARRAAQREAAASRTGPAALITALVVLLGGAGLLMLLAPGGPGAFTGGDAGPVLVTGGASASLYRSLTDALADAPHLVHLALEIASEGSVIALGLLLLWTCWSALRRSDARTAAATVLAGTGTLLAYAASETFKLMVDEERPCRAVSGADPVAACPPPGDWSFPSNHSTLAFGLAVGLSVLRPRLAPIALPLGALAGLLRVAVGVHYPHDVLAGFTLGGAVTAALVLALTAAAARVLAPLLERWGPRLRLVRQTDAAVPPVTQGRRRASRPVAPRAENLHADPHGDHYAASASGRSVDGGRDGGPPQGTPPH
ncbi:phosphatase PAP2 family protein [Streptomyces avicenniae]|uniref:phosphatase PAP2 family protein n=1 Tax=Streptomyces avicenniae TaxID=500153 RepID=UPI000A520BCB|nr:phosphatase PAP2 family protein [Streptomyces avicenniae]